MTYGIAAYKVTPQFCEDEVNYILAIGGITIKYNQELEGNISLADLQKNYDAVYLGIGVGLARQLEIPGEELDGVEEGITHGVLRYLCDGVISAGYVGMARRDRTTA